MGKESLKLQRYTVRRMDKILKAQDSDRTAVDKNLQWTKGIMDKLDVNAADIPKGHQIGVTKFLPIDDIEDAKFFFSQQDLKEALTDFIRETFAMDPSTFHNNVASLIYTTEFRVKNSFPLK